jgi:8-oxo-dGTP pyrophosphatase MutT (NUDIX family)
MGRRFATMANESYPPHIDREALVARLAKHPPLDQLMTADDIERQKANAALPAKPAAVLVLLVDHPGAPSIVLTQRTRHLADHAGQISFPGGRCHDDDCTPERTALREAEEEIGLEIGRVTLLGRLPDYHTSTGYNVTPVVGCIDPPVAFRADPHEVEEIFEVPLAFLLDPRNHRYESAFFKGRMRHYWAMPFGRHFIWGATAGMLVTLQRILAPVPVGA